MQSLEARIHTLVDKLMIPASPDFCYESMSNERAIYNFPEEDPLADNQPEEFFVERVANMSHANGVFRITFAQQEEEADLRQVVRLMIPANQLAGILQGISGAAKNIGEQVQARIGDTEKIVSKAKAQRTKTGRVSKKKATTKK